MRTSARLTVLIAGLLLSASGGARAVVSTEDIPRLIRQLGAAGYEERTRAGELLWEIGEPAVDLLEKAAASDDPEVSLRARDILTNIAHGIQPSWPAALRRRLRSYDKIKADDKQALLKQIAATYERDAVPFLLTRIRKGLSQDARFAVGQLTDIADETVWQRVLHRIPEAGNEYEGDLLAAACKDAGDIDDITRVLRGKHLGRNSRAMLIGLAVRELRGLLDRFSYEEAAEGAARLAVSVPTDARFVYLEAAATAQLHGQDRARPILVKALSLNPGSEKHHFTAATMLSEMGQDGLASLEWKRILAIPPEGDVYDINAHMRLARIYAGNKMYGKAADSYEAGLDMYRAARKRHGRSMGMVGADEDDLKRRIAECRAKARAGGGGDGARVGRSRDDEHVKASLETVIKDDKAGEMREFMKSVAATISANVKPHGFRLFEVTNASVRYDSEKEELVVLLNNSPCTKPVNCRLREGRDCVAVDSLDMRYLYRIDPDEDKPIRIASFEKDYVFRLAASPGLREWKDVVVEVNSKEYAWDALKKGIPYDFLPVKIVIVIKGTAPDGKRQRIEKTVSPVSLEAEPGSIREPTAIGIKLPSVPVEEAEDR